MEIKNLLENLPINRKEEVIEVLQENEMFRVERIVSFGQCSPKDFWYDQDEIEWVMVLMGEAKLQFEGEAELIELRTGDQIEIPAHKKHRVEWTLPNHPTVWLAIFTKLSN